MSKTVVVLSETKQEKQKENERTNLEIKILKPRELKKVKFSEDTVDNEHMGKRKSKICCIYHRPRLNPDDTSEDSCSSCDEKGKNAYERPNHYDRHDKKVK